MTILSVPDLVRLANRSSEHLERILTTLAQNLERIEDDAYSTLRAQSFEPSESTSHLWCITHDQTLLRCERDDRADCVVGARQDEGPGRSDPTGEAVGRHNSARSTLKQVRRDLEALERLVGHLDTLVRPVVPVDGALLATASRKAQSENAKADGCELCDRVENWQPVCATGDLNGVLDRPYRLCRACIDFGRNRLRVPDKDELLWHKRKGKGWPPIRQTERLRIGIAKGKLG